MKWLVIEDGSGAWESLALDCIESITWDGRLTVYVARRGLAPKGYQPRSICIAEEPVFGKRNPNVRAMEDHPAVHVRSAD